MALHLVHELASIVSAVRLAVSASQSYRERAERRAERSDLTAR